MKDGLIKRGGTWSFVIDVGDQPAQRCNRCAKRRWVDGTPLAACPDCGGDLSSVRERRQRWHSGYPTRAAARAARDEARVRLARGTYVPPSTITVEEYLLGWLEGVARQRKAGTVAAYRHKLTCYVVPALGSIRLQQLGPRHLEALYVDLLERGGPGGPLSVSTVRTIHAILRKSLQDAYRRDELALNVAAKATVPTHRADTGDGPSTDKAGGPVMRSWDSEQVRAFVDAVEGLRLGPAYVLAINTGMRRGEVLGLSWADVDLDASRLTVRQSLVTVNGHTQLTTPKTGRPRSFVIDGVSVAALRSVPSSDASACCGARRGRTPVWSSPRRMAGASSPSPSPRSSARRSAPLGSHLSGFTI